MKVINDSQYQISTQHYQQRDQPVSISTVRVGRTHGWTEGRRDTT